MPFSWKNDFKIILAVCVASVLMALNINTFVQTGGLYPGGATGLTILIQRIAEKFLDIRLSFAVVNFLLNMIPIYIGFRYIGKRFTLYSCLMIVLTGILTDLIPSYIITYDILLISIFGGIINGFSISLCLRMDTTSGGTDFIAIYLSRKKGIDSWNIILYFNVILLLVAGFTFGWDKALYSIFFQYTTTQVLHILYTRYQKKTLFIVTDNPREVCDVIYATSKHGATILKGEGSFHLNERSLVYSVVSSDESKKVVNAIREVDPYSFINTVKTQELAGLFYQRPTL
ncbi:YitT family protein [Mailhella massiliensis]|uniref:YitT family protein n=1 Tax=Mailhella massiliensis TaxID=1903261 RepID=A0A921AXN1_9BACT|nr:YitT family protein [Mailhella massiliensis]HJD97754.1 YitT family protein [Mailhella massiliensis]